MRLQHMTRQSLYSLILPISSKTMDYSTIDHEHSPWASSPQHSRTPSGAPEPEPPSPTPALPPSSIQDRSSHDDTSTRISQDTTAVENGHTDEPPTPTSAVPPLSPDQRQAPQLQQHLSPQVEQTQQQPPAPQKATKSAQRYHGQRPRSRQDMPVYKLQPRITGLERPTRKELNIRFDVHVGVRD